MDEDESPQNFRTTSTPPHLARLLKRSPTRDADVVKAQAIDRRETFLQQRKDRLAQCRLKHNQVLVRGRVDIPAKLEALRESLSAAQAARNAIYAKIAANGSKEVAKVNFVVQQNKEKLRLERETKRLALELKQVEAEKRRETALQNRILRRRSASPPSRHSDNSESRDVVAIRRVSDPITAAILLQRFWRSKRTTRRAKNFLRLHLDYGTVGTVPFDVVADVIKGRDVVRCAGKVLESLHIVSSASESSSNAALCRVFLATFMIIGHPRDILMREGPLEDELIHRAKDFAGKFQHWIYAASQGRALCHAEVQTSWTSFSHTFDRWKQVDSANLLEIMIAQYCELDLIYQIVKLDSDPIVATEYHTAIRDNQLQLLVRIRGIAGDETRNLVRSAVIAARRKRLPKRTIVSKPKDIPAVSERLANSSNIQFFALGQRQTRLSNRQLIHELALDSSFQLGKTVVCDADSRHEDEMKTTFFDSLQTEMRENRSISWVPIVVQECKMRLLRLVMPGSPTFKAITSVFDIPSVELQCKSGCYDYNSFTTTVIDMMAALCSPARDRLVADIKSLRGVDSVDLFAKRVNSIFTVLDTLLLDSANFHLSISAPRLIPEAIPYEQKLFGQDLEGGTTSLTRTRAMLLRSWNELKSDIVARDVENVQHPKSLPTTSAVVRHALTRVFTNSEAIPETLCLDLERTAAYRAQSSRIVSIASHLIVARNLMRAKSRYLSPSSWTSIRDRLLTLMKEGDRADAMSVAAELNNHLDLALIGTEEEDRSKRHEALTKLVTKDKESDPVNKLLFRRLQALMQDAMSGTDITGTKIASAGLDDLSAEVETLLMNVKKVTDLNWSCYHAWYSRILS